MPGDKRRQVAAFPQIGTVKLGLILRGSVSRSKQEDLLPRVRDQHRQRGSERIQSAIEQRAGPAGNPQLVEFIRQGIQGRSHNAQHRTPRPPEMLGPFDGWAIKKQSKDGVFDQVGELAYERM
jgi:hypothetical protein